MSDKNNVVLKRFQKLIDTSGMTRQAIARDIGCDTSTVTKQYNGDLKISVDYLVKYAYYFSVSADYLLGLSDAETGDKDLRFVCEYTGLSAEASKRLNDIKDGHKEYLSIIDFSLSNKGYEEWQKLCISLLAYRKQFQLFVESGAQIIDDESINTFLAPNDRYFELLNKWVKNHSRKDVTEQRLNKSFNNFVINYCIDLESANETLFNFLQEMHEINPQYKSIDELLSLID